MVSVGAEGLDLKSDEYKTSDYVSTFRDPNDSDYFWGTKKIYETLRRSLWLLTLENLSINE